MSYNFQKQIDFLLEHACPSIKYLVHRDMLNVPMNEPFMVALQNEIATQTNTQNTCPHSTPTDGSGMSFMALTVWTVISVAF